MTDTSAEHREGSLEAPTRHPIDWKSDQYYDQEDLFGELQRVFDICHGCRRCVSLCNSFPTLFDLVDESETLEIDGVASKDYWKVVDHCYLCDLCFMTKCPYVPPHPWNVDYPHLMLRAKAVKFKQQGARTRDKLLSATDAVGNLAGIPVVAAVVNAANRSKPVRKVLDKVLDIHPDAPLPSYHSKTLRKVAEGRDADRFEAQPTKRTRGQVALFATCYANRNAPQIGEDLMAIFKHNRIPLRLTDQERCCAMPKLELGDLAAVEQAMQANIPELARLVDQGWDIIAPIPSCVLMFKQELPLMFPDHAGVKKVQENIFDPFEYLMLRHKDAKLNTDFTKPLGKIAYHAPCHQRVQNIGLKTRDVLALVPDTQVEVIERCSGHDGTYAVKSEFHDIATKLCRPVVSRVEKAMADHYTSDCPMAAEQIANGLSSGSPPINPFALLRIAYGC